MKRINIIHDGAIIETLTPGEFSSFVRIVCGNDDGLSQGLDYYVEQFNAYSQRVGHNNHAEVQS